MLILLAATGALAAPQRSDVPALPPQVRQVPARPDRDDDDAEEEEGRVDPASPIVVTGRRLDVARTAVDAALGATRYALTNETVENRPGGETGSVAAVLRQAPGAVGGGERLLVRGAPVEQVRINGVVLPAALPDPAELLGARLAERTELIAGPLPAQFGYAPGAVVSVTTKNGLYQHGGQAELFAGTRGFLEPAVEWAGSVARTSLFASGSLERATTAIGDASGAIGRERRHGLAGFAFADHVFDDANRASLMLGGSDEQRRVSGAVTPVGVARDRAGFAAATLQHSAGGTTVQAALTLGAAAQRGTDPLAGRATQRSLGLQLDATREMGERHVVRAGVLATRERAVLENGGVARRSPVAVYLQDEWRVTDRLTLDPGVRLEWLRGTGRAAVAEPRAAVVWAAGEALSLHAGYARSGRAPALDEATGTGLADERLDTVGAGAQLRRGDLALGIDAYRRTARHALAAHLTPGEASAEAFGFARARWQGIEATALLVEGASSAWANLAIGSARGRGITARPGLFAPATLAASARGDVPLSQDHPLVASAGVVQRVGPVSLAADMLVASGAPYTGDAARPNGERHATRAVIDLAAVGHARLFDRPVDLRVDLTDATDGAPVESDARALDGGWTRRGRGRALTIGIEQGF